MMGACTSSDFALGGEARVAYNFSVFLGRVSYFVRVFNLFYQVFSFFTVSIAPYSQNNLLCLGFSFDLFVFLFVSIKLESGFQKNNLSSSNLGLIRFWYRGTFFF